MKAQAIQVTPTWLPIQVTITLDTRKEAELFYTMFNYTPLAQAFGGERADQIRAALCSCDSSIAVGRLPENFKETIKHWVRD